MQLRIVPADRDGRLLAITFPFNEALTRFVKTVPGREWHPGTKSWRVPNTPETLLYLRDRKPALVTLSIEPSVVERFKRDVAALSAAHAHRERGDADVEHTWVTQPYAHQRAGLAHLIALDSGALLWEMGLGKTKTAIDYAEWIRANRNLAARILVIAPNTVARNWGREIELHAGHSAYVMLTGIPMAKRIDLAGTAMYSIVNCEALSHAAFVDALIKRPAGWDLVIVDESTRFKTPGAARTKALLKLGKRASRRLILTGTPITGSPEDAWSQMEFIQPGIFGSHYGFVDRFLYRDEFHRVVGIREGMADELALRIARRSYRVLKRDVLDLPEKVYTERTVELTPDQRKAYDQMRDELRIELADRTIDAYNVLTKLLRLTQVTAGLVGEGDRYTWIENNAKAVELDHLINEELKGEQVVIFGLYRKELEALARRYALPSVGLDKWDLPPIIYGPTPEKVRHELVEQFQAGQRRLLFCQIRTGGIGINLTAAQTAVYVTRSWSLEEWLQSQDRLHRIGQKGTVSIVSLTAKGTVDEQISKALGKKQKVADRLTGDAARSLIRDVLEG